MKSKIMGLLLASTLITSTMAADVNFGNPVQIKSINLGKNSLVSLSDPKLDEVLENMPICNRLNPQGRFGIGGESIKIAHDITTAVLSNNLDINSFQPDHLSRFLICTSVCLQISSKPIFAPNTFDKFGSQRLIENPNVLYNIDKTSFHGICKNAHVVLDSENLMTAYLLLKEKAQQNAEIALPELKAEEPKLTQEEIDKSFSDKYTPAINSAMLLTQGKPAAEHLSILGSNTFSIIDEHELRALTTDEARKIMHWIYEGGTLEDFA